MRLAEERHDPHFLLLLLLPAELKKKQSPHPLLPTAEGQEPHPEPVGVEQVGGLGVEDGLFMIPG